MNYYIDFAIKGYCSFYFYKIDYILLRFRDESSIFLKIILNISADLSTIIN